MIVQDPLAALVQATARADQNAFAELYRLTSGRLYAIGRRILGHGDQADDALQETYVRIWTRAGDFDPARGRAIHWMSGILRHTAIDLIRRGVARREDAADWEDLDIPVAPHEMDHLDIERCMAALDAAQARTIRLAVLYGMSHTELAERFKQPVGTVKSTIRRGLAKLKTCLGSENAYV